MSNALESGPRPDDKLSVILEMVSVYQALKRSGQNPRPEDVCPDEALLPEVIKRIEDDEKFGAGGIESAATTPNAPAPAPVPPVAVPGFQIECELGRGAFGVVYRALQTELNRHVALKVLTGATPRELRRIRSEAEAMAAVRHEHVVQIYEVLKDDDQYFLVLEYMPKGSLTKRLDPRRPMPPLEAATLLAKVAKGVAAAHEADVVHRDLKPGNILFDARDEPKVGDFGLAKYGNSNLTASNAVMGTPAYMAPEQAHGHGKYALPTADVWALGVILYECLSGKRPFDGESVFDVLAKIATEEPPALRTAAPGAPRDLEIIVGKCLRREEYERYPTAVELAADLRAFLAGEPIKARPVGATGRAIRWVRRKPAHALAWMFGLALLALLVGAGAGVTLLWQRQAQKDRERQAQKDRDEAQAQLNNSRRQQEQAWREYRQTMADAHGECRTNPVHALGRLANTDRSRHGWEFDYVHRLCRARDPRVDSITRLEFFARPKNASSVYAAAFSPNGEQIATGHKDKTVRLWNTATGDETGSLKGHDGEVFAVAYSPVGGAIATAGYGDTVRVWDPSTGRQLFQLDANEPSEDGRFVLALAFSPDGERLAVGYANGTVRVWNRETRQELFRLKGREGNAAHLRAVAAVAFSRDGSRIATASWDKTSRVWNAETGGQIASVNHNQEVMSVAFSPDGNRVVTACRDGLARIWDAANGKELYSLKGHASEVFSVAFSPDGSQIVTAGADQTVRVWNADTGNERFLLRGHDEGVNVAAYSPDGSRILSASDDGTTGLWGANSEGEFLPLHMHTKPVKALGYATNGSLIVAAAEDGSVRAWDAVSGKAASVRVPAPARPESTVRHGTRIASIGPGGEVSVSDTQTNDVLFVLKGRGGAVHSVAFNPTGNRLVTAGADGTVRVWEAEFGIELLPLKVPGGPVHVAIWSADGSQIVTGSQDGIVRIWSAKMNR